MKWGQRCLSRFHVLFTIGLVFTLTTTTLAMKKDDFKTCAQSGFCRRNRAYADIVTETGDSFQSPYTLITDSVRTEKSHIYADVKNTESDILLTLDVYLLQDNTARVRVNEKQPIKPRYDGHGKHTLQAEPVLQEGLDKNNVETSPEGVVTITMNDDKTRKIVIHPNPLRLEFLVNDSPVISLNNRGLFNFEHLRTKESHKPKMIQHDKDSESTEEKEAPWESGSWEESFKTWTDPKPNGPESIAMDITFHDFGHVYGIPEHASSLSLKETRGGDNAYTDPYRLYNTDVFEYAVDSPTSLYGAVPFMVAHRVGQSAGVFWMNPSETWVDIVKSKSEEKVLSFGKKSSDKTSTHTHWISEAGVLDVFVFFGPTTKDVIRQYTKLTGTPMLPQQFALGYHQCRWNYINQKDVLDVDSQFDEHDMPYDVIWLDIEYTDDRKYFTWENNKFPEPIKMEQVLDSKGRKLVVIIDPHIKRADNYRICEEAKKDGLFVKQPNGNDYEAWCWPGQSSWVDFYNPEAREWWKEQFKFNKFIGTQENVHVWNDMNEPSVFNGPEITMQKEMIHHGNWEHRVLHNLYSLLSFQSTSDGVRERTAVEHRPFVLTRGFYAGAQRYGAVWTGDNMADWDALYYSNPMSLTNGMGGIVFTGADVPGFFNNPTSELLVRWYQAAVYQPFFRGHAHIDTKRREPYLVPEPYRSMTLAALRERYALLPYWYTLFYDASQVGTPMMRPMFMEFPDDESLFVTEDQFMLGSGIMVKPVTVEGATSTEVYFAGDEPWYDTLTHAVVKLTGRHNVNAPLGKIPAYYRGGNIIPRRERVRRSSHSMKLDPFTLVIALDTQGNAEGTLYVDDGETYDYGTGAYIHTKFNYSNGALTCENIHADPNSKAAQQYAKDMKSLRIERIHILGVSKKPNGIQAESNDVKENLVFEYNSAHAKISIKDPKTSIAECGWTIAVA
ncbi:glycosyl hydrolases family 31-domain-containing protein [Circinella umbellata]|nr:glycosyl hydrolases family 31-domain-containing protein [Circinella umbellata]